MRGIDFVDDIIVKGFRGHNAAFFQPLVQQALLQSRDEAAEDVARAKVNPHGRSLRGVAHGAPVETWQGDTGGLPRLRVGKAVGG